MNEKVFFTCGILVLILYISSIVYMIYYKKRNKERNTLLEEYIDEVEAKLTISNLLVKSLKQKNSTLRDRIFMLEKTIKGLDDEVKALNKLSE